MTCRCSSERWHLLNQSVCSLIGCCISGLQSSILVWGSRSWEYWRITCNCFGQDDAFGPIATYPFRRRPQGELVIFFWVGDFLIWNRFWSFHKWPRCSASLKITCCWGAQLTLLITACWQIWSGNLPTADLMGQLNLTKGKIKWTNSTTVQAWTASC